MKTFIYFYQKCKKERPEDGMLVFFSSGQFWLSDGNFFLGKFTQIKGTVREISSDQQCKNGNARFTRKLCLY